MKEYRFVDHWTIRAPIIEVYDHVADPRTYARWWKTYNGVRILVESLCRVLPGHCPSE